MKYKTAFRLAVRLLGLYLIAQSLPWLVGGCGFMAISFVAAGAFGSNSPLWGWGLQTGVVHFLSILLGLYLFFGGTWIVNRVIPSNRPYCPECAYEVTGLPAEGICPECGTVYKGLGRPAPPA